MDGISKDILDIILKLLPGFIVAWILYGLTSHLKPSSFERIVQALVYTALVRAVLIPLKLLAFIIGSHHSLGIWDGDIEYVWSIIIAIATGLFISWCINNDFPLLLFRKDGEEKCSSYFKWVNKLLSTLKLSGKTLHPNEWYSAFKSNEMRIVLHLSGERRLECLVIQYPDDPQQGHFLIIEPAWLLDDGSRAPLYSTNQILLPSSEVEYVEFLKAPVETTESEEEINAVLVSLTKLYKKEIEDVDKCAETTIDTD